MNNFSFDPFETIQFRSLQGQVEQLINPAYRIDSDDFHEILDRTCWIITYEFAKRRSVERKKKDARKQATLFNELPRLAKTQKDDASPLQWLKPVCYQFVLGFLEKDVFDLLEARSERLGRYTKSPQVEPSVFSRGIMAIFAHVKAQDDLALLTVMQRKRLACEMWFALRHFIPAPLINGFNSQYPLHDPKRQSTENELIPELVDWIVDQFSLETLRDIQLSWVRGPYPAAIMERFEMVSDDLNLLQYHGTKQKITNSDDWGSDSEESASPNSTYEDQNWD